MRKSIVRASCIRAALAAVCGMLLAGCLVPERKPVEKRYYNLEIAREDRAQNAAADRALKVRRLAISPRYAGRELVYKTGETAFESDFYNEFFIPPAEMLTQDLRAWLDRSGLFAHVLDPASLAQAGLVLEGAVNALYGDFSRRPPVAVAKLQFFLIDERSAEGAILFSRDYAREVALDAGSPRDLVLGLRAAVRDVFASLEADLREALTQSRAAPAQ